MSRSKYARRLAAAFAAIAAFAAPTAASGMTDQNAPAAAPPTTSSQQDLRSPDAASVGVYSTDLRSPDAIAAGSQPASAPAQAVADDGTDWVAFAGGAALFLMLAAALFVMAQRHGGGFHRPGTHGAH